MSTAPGAVPAAALEAALRFINRNKPATVTESVAKETFAEVLKSAARKPVTVTRNGKPAAVLLSARHYGELEQLLKALILVELEEQEEDRHWLKKIGEAKEAEFLSPKESEEFLRKMANGN